MSDWNDAISRSARLGEVALWIGASLVVLAVHFGAAIWVLREPPMVQPQSAPPAVMIELAPEPVVQKVEEEIDLAPDETMMEQVESAAEEAPEKPSEEPVEPELEPVEEATQENESKDVAEPAEEEAEPVQEMVDTPADDVEVPLPKARPAPPKRKARRSPSRQRQAAPRSAAPPKVEAKRAERTAAAEPSRNTRTPRISPARWKSRLLAHLERYKRYPSGARSRRMQGIVYLRFTIDAAGQVSRAHIARSSGFAELDRAVLAMLRRASPVPAPPAGVNRDITVPVRFTRH